MSIFEEYDKIERQAINDALFCDLKSYKENGTLTYKGYADIGLLDPHNYAGCIIGDTKTKHFFICDGERFVGVGDL